jgi:hypothetical protein
VISNRYSHSFRCPKLCCIITNKLLATTNRKATFTSENPARVGTVGIDTSANHQRPSFPYTVGFFGSQQPYGGANQNHQSDKADRRVNLPCEQREPDSQLQLTFLHYQSPLTTATVCSLGNAKSAASVHQPIQRSKDYLLPRSFSQDGSRRSHPTAQESVVYLEQPVNHGDHDCGSLPQGSISYVDHNIAMPEQEGVGFGDNTLPSAYLSEMELENHYIFSDPTMLGTYTQ